LVEQLIEAAKAGDTATIRSLIRSDPALLQASAPNGETPLIAALYAGMRPAVETLLELGVHINIFEAAAIGDEATVAYMLDHAPELVHEFSFDGWTALHLAAFFGEYETAALLIKRGADVNARSRNRLAHAPIHVAASGKRTAVVHLLLSHGADPNARQQDGRTPLHQAVDHYDIGTIKLLLDYGGDPGIADEQGMDAVRLAEEKAYDDIAALLRDKRPPA
jgi:ankyrin repeat protein